jgi:hypothetical protein
MSKTKQEITDLILNFKNLQNSSKMDCYGCEHHKSNIGYGGENLGSICKLRSTPGHEYYHDNDGCSERKPDLITHVSDEEISLVEYALWLENNNKRPT